MLTFWGRRERWTTKHRLDLCTKFCACQPGITGVSLTNQYPPTGGFWCFFNRMVTKNHLLGGLTKRPQFLIAARADELCDQCPGDFEAPQLAALIDTTSDSPKNTKNPNRFEVIPKITQNLLFLAIPSF